MKAHLLAAVFAGIVGLTCSCSKKPAASTPQSAVITTPAGTFDLADVDKALAETNYSGAVDLLLRVRSQSASLTEQQRIALDQKVQSFLDAIGDIKYNDPKAMEAYKRLGTGMSGR
jgi:hypothetical protein